MALTSDQLADMQADIGITDDGTVFTDAELNRLYARAEENYNLAVYFAYRQLLALANKFHDYTAGMTNEKRSQMRAHIADALKIWRTEAHTTDDQLRSIGLEQVPTIRKEEPESGKRLLVTG